ncbi:hypothetical protein MMC21_000099, partial [Puttea exsequens]|nr:hypothetical protein [Puttea exsequens]
EPQAPQDRPQALEAREADKAAEPVAPRNPDPAPKLTPAEALEAAGLIANVIQEAATMKTYPHPTLLHPYVPPTQFPPKP